MAVAGVVIGVDPGAVRTGMAATDPGQLLASPVRTLEAGEDVSGVVTEVQERDAVAVVVGLPIALSGQEGTAAQVARSYARRLAAGLAELAPVFLVDERLTTVTAHAALKAAGHDSRSARRVVDQAAAAALLQGVVDAAQARQVDCLTLLSAGMGELVTPSSGQATD
ncbi:MAG TPA: Holliday junction resolvase RuvX [Actinomycetes bacterium]|nr:Holliday junction resolvase RuvX [Actinomycetes bacterium]